MLYLLTFSCYGCHLPGDPRGSFDHVRRGCRQFLPPNAALENYHRRQMKQHPYRLSSATARKTVRDAIVEVCRYRSWFLCALHVRTTHVHAIVEADCPPRSIFNGWKAYATRKLRASGEDPKQNVWAHGGSTRRILESQDLTRAMDYVLSGQGEILSTYWAVPGGTRALTRAAEPDSAAAVRPGAP